MGSFQDTLQPGSLTSSHKNERLLSGDPRRVAKQDSKLIDAQTQTNVNQPSEPHQEEQKDFRLKDRLFVKNRMIFSSSKDLINLPEIAVEDKMKVAYSSHDGSVNNFNSVNNFKAVKSSNSQTHLVTTRD